MSQRQKLVPRDLADNRPLRKVRVQNGGVLTPNQPGHKTGRPRGVPNRITTVVKEAILLAGAIVGLPKRVEICDDDGNVLRVEWQATGDHELVGYFIHLALTEPKTYGLLLGRTMPLQVTAKVDHQVTHYKTVEECKRALIEHSVPVTSVYDVN